MIKSNIESKQFKLQKLK